MAPKTVWVFALLLAVTLPTFAAAADKPPKLDPHRRTLYVTLGENPVRFEAPKDMCFADPTRRGEGELAAMIAASLRQKGDETLLGVFMPCDSLANPMHAMAREGRVPSFGLITWPQQMEDRGPWPTNARYLDWRSASFHEYVAVNLTGWLGAADALRQPGDTAKVPELAPGPAQGENGLFTTYNQYLSADGRPFPTVGAVGTTLLRGHPVEFILRLNAASGVEDEMAAHDFMANFLDLQAAINR